MKRLLRHPEDLHMVLFHVFVLTTYVVAWEGWQHAKLSELGWIGTIAFMVAIGLSQGIAVGVDVAVNFHNRIHLPVWRNVILDAWFARLWTISSGWPAFIFAEAHRIHHDKLHTGDDWTLGPTGENGRHPHIIMYAFTAWPWRAVRGMMAEVRSRGGEFRRTLILESTFFLAVWLLPFWIDPVAAVVVWLIPQVAGNLIVVGGGMHIQHAVPESTNEPKRRDSITALNKWFNLMMFNIGFHHTHHDYPKVHWSALPRLFEKKADSILASDSRVLLSGNFKQASILAGWSTPDEVRWNHIDEERVRPHMKLECLFSTWYKNLNFGSRIIGRSGLAICALIVAVISIYSPVAALVAALLEYKGAKKFL